MDILYRLQFIIELLLAELIFLYPVKKRSYFPLRLIGILIAVITVFSLIPSFSLYDRSALFQIVNILLYFGVTVLLMSFCFKLKILSLISCCVAGYAVQHIVNHSANIVDNLFSIIRGTTLSISQHFIIEIICCIIIYMIVYLTLGRFSAKKQYYAKSNMSFNYISFAVVFICVGLTRTARIYGIHTNMAISFYAITCCVLALTIQFVLYHVVDLQYENETINLLLMEKQRQYELSKKTIDTIDIKYHDLKHKLGHMNLPEKELDALRETMRIYGSMIKTGNEPLDVILTENNLRCTEDGIRLTCMGNGEELNFMETMDVYSLFGNAVENAVYAVKNLSNPEKKVIDIVIEKVGAMVNINISNYFEGELKFSENLPVTTKTNNIGFHGFGIKSMKLISEKYNGSLSIKTDGDLFILNIYMLQSETNF